VRVITLFDIFFKNVYFYLFSLTARHKTRMTGFKCLNAYQYLVYPCTLSSWIAYDLH
jgi:hypothetical protein